MVVVAAAITDPDGRLLLQQRPAGKHHGGLWEFPGGKVEPGENHRQALVREIEEELGLILEEPELDLAGEAREGASATRPEIVMLLYSTAVYAGAPEGRECQQWGWFAVDAAAGLPLAPMDRALIALFDPRPGT